MPSTLPSSFASAAAGNADSSSGARNTRPDGAAYADWTRRPNGATQTFRRTSTATTNSTQAPQREMTANNGGASAQNVGVYVPPHISASRNGGVLDMRYAKTQLLDLFREQRDSRDLENGIAELYVGDVDGGGGVANGGATNRWSRREEPKTETAGGSEACWDRGGGIEPMGLFDLTEEEKELLGTSVNSTIKASTGPTAREGNQREPGTHRKLSVSQGHGNSQAFATASPTTTRPSNRRRELSESYPFPNQPGGQTSNAGKSSREDPTGGNQEFGLTRRKTDVLANEEETAVEEREDESHPGNILGGGTPFGTVKRRVLPPISAGLAGPSSPWGPAPPSAGFSPMGAFGNFGGGGLPSSSFSSEKQPNAGLARNESRFRGLMSKSNTEETGSPLREKSSIGMLGRQDLTDFRRRSPEHNEDDMDDSMGSGRYVEEGRPYGSAVLGGGQDGSSESAPTQNRRNVDNNASFGGYDADIEDRNASETLRSQTFSGYHQTASRTQESLSPTFTNPYQSPHQQTSDLRDADSDDTGMENFHLPGLGAFQGAPAQGGQPGMPGETRPSDRTPGYDSRYFERGLPQTGGSTRGFPSLSGLGGLAGLGGLTGLGSPGPWSNNNPIGTPTRERGNIADLLNEQRARTPSEMHSPSVAGNAFGAVGGFGYNSSGTIGRGSSKLGSLFPTTMQEQMRTSDHAPFGRDGEAFQHDSEGFDDSSVVSGSNAFPVRRDMESPMRTGRGKFDEFFGNVEKQQTFRGADASGLSDQASLSQQYSPAVMHAPVQPQGQQNFQSMQQGGQRVASLSSSASNQPPAAQQKTMVMPDRIRWIYRDPQGNTQGPWSGLEMHDWYRAGFFSPELLVKKVEDADYEPLAQLIRRIGNSREPFLVPQIGIPGPPTSQTAATWPNQTLPPVPTAVAAAAQPPFAGSFPSFGTTLTADQQNALERRKQEEQYLMARQKEHLAQQQILVKQMQMQGQHGLHPQLHTQASAQSLHSQPSFGSITSPGGFQASPIQGINHLVSNLPAGYDSAFRAGGGSAIGTIGTGVETLGHIREEGASFDRQSHFSGAQAPIGQQRESFDDFSANDHRISAMLADRARLAEEQEDDDQQRNESRDEVDATRERLQEFRKLTREIDDQGDQYQNASRKEESPAYNDSFGRRQKDGSSQQIQDQPHEALESLSLTEQVQKAASAKQSPLISSQSAWASLDTTMLETIPPPQSASPLPAPAARRNRSHVADALAAESRSQSQTPSVDTPAMTLAPWAQQTTESHKQPSLKEIQEAEARRAAKQEEIAAAARRALLEKELASQAAPQQPAPGLPSSSTWARTESPVTVQSAASSAWAKSAAAKANASGGSMNKKTMQQIVQEEEALARKKKAALAAAASVAATTLGSGIAPVVSTGKRYADLAGKAASPAPGPAGAWTTVGAGGKTKTPATPTIAPAAVKAPSVIPSASAPVRPKAVTTVTAASKTSLAAAQLNAYEEFKKWAIAELRPDLHKDIQVDDFVQNLLNFPSDTDLITEAVHMSSRTVDSRHFAEEFVRRRGLAEKGKAEPVVSGAAGAGGHAVEGKGGWSEVAARKGSGVAGGAAPQKDEGSAFKIIAAKKKGGKK